MLPINVNVGQFFDIELASNEFNDYNDYFGLFEQDVEPHEFLSIENISPATVTFGGLSNEEILPPIPNSKTIPPYLEVNFKLS